MNTEPRCDQGHPQCCLYVFNQFNEFKQSLTSLFKQQSQFWITYHVYISMYLDFPLMNKEMDLLRFNLLLKIILSKYFRTIVRYTSI